MRGGIERLTFMESKILELGKKQHEKGYQGGAFTPGFIRKETEYGYRAINIALESLIERGLVEKSVTSTFRNGEPVELDVYKITDKGLLVVDDITAGSVQINGREPATQPNPRREPEPRAYSKPWEGPKPQMRRDQGTGHAELAQTVQNLESTIATMRDDIKALHEKLDAIMHAHPKVAPQPAPHKRAEPAPAPRKRKARALSKEALFQRVLVLKAVVAAGKLHDVVLSEDVKGAYQEMCETAGVKPKTATQFNTLIKRMQADGLLDLQRKGCKALGIKGQGTRVAVSLTQEGKGMVGGK